MKRKVVLFLTAIALNSLPLVAQNIVAPKRGLPVPAETRGQLEADIAACETATNAIARKFATNEGILQFLPDAAVFHISVKRTLEDEIFFKASEFAIARVQLETGRDRLEQLLAGNAPWNEQSGLVTRGYRSRIDGSIQPYQLWVPPEYHQKKGSRRLDVWHHGRNNNLSEVAFIGKSTKAPGAFIPKNGFVLAPYGRFCNAMKFAGEVDTWEALAHAKRFYAIDDARISVRGFSMGGAATWHLGAHHASRWVAVNPGAGFVETKIYQNLLTKLDEIPVYEQQLWRLYDSLDYVVNLQNTTLVAYSGEIDKQKAAADLMENALAKEGITMTHIIGPDTGHKYETKARETVAGLVDAAVAAGRLEPKSLRFVTYTMKYNQMHWVTIEGLEQHWQRARVEAELKSTTINATTTNISAIKFALTNARASATDIILDGQKFAISKPTAGEQPSMSFVKVAGKWSIGTLEGIRKSHNLQGPIDDAFMDSFIFVEPVGAGWHSETDEFIRNELKDAKFQWRRQMRGSAQVKSATDITESDIANSNLILWGDPKSNPMIARILQSLPLQWTAKSIAIGDEEFDTANSAPVLIYPNPLNPQRYIVINSGPTFMQFGAQSNSMQTPKLPDFAILDTMVPVQKRIRGAGVRQAGFFGEQWQMVK